MESPRSRSSPPSAARSGGATGSPVGAAPGRPWGAFALASLIAIPLAVASCAHQPREFDVSPQASDERLPAPEAVAAVLSGTWEFDPRASDQPDRANGGGRGGMEGGRRGGRGGFGGGGRGGYPGAGGMPGSGGDFPGSAGMPGREGDSGGGRSAAGRGGERRGGFDSTLAAPRRLVLAQTDSSLTITRPGGASATLYFDGRTVYVPDPRGEGQTEVNGLWHNKRFEVRRSLANGRSVMETYELSKDGTKLTVRSRMGGGEREQAGPEIRRVYDRVADEGPAPAPAPPSSPPRGTQRIGGSYR